MALRRYRVMKANKYTIIICVVIDIISLYLMLIIKDSSSKSFVVAVGIFTGILVSLVSTMVIYFDKRATIYQAVKTNIADIYINLTIIHSMTGNILNQIQYFYNLKELNYKMLIGLAELNTSFVSGMQIGLYEPMFPIGKKYNAINEMKDFENDLFNLKLCIGKIQNVALEHDLLLTMISNSNRQPTTDESNRLNEFRTLVLVQTAKVHEYQAPLLQKIDKIAGPFYGKGNKSWDNVKKQLFAKADMILKQN